MPRRRGNCTVKRGVRRRAAIQAALVLVGLGLGVGGMMSLARLQHSSGVLAIMNGLVLGGILSAVLVGQLDRWMPPGS